MGRSREDVLGYQRGYRQGTSNKWPHYLDASSVPDAAYRALAEAAMCLERVADRYLASMDDRDSDELAREVDAARTQVVDSIVVAKMAAIEPATPPASPWRPIDEAPKVDGRPVYLWDESRQEGILAEWSDCAGGWWDTWRDEPPENPTLFAPLPSPPEVKP